jgi:hypothetical protein
VSPAWISILFSSAQNDFVIKRCCPRAILIMKIVDSFIFGWLHVSNAFYHITLAKAIECMMWLMGLVYLNENVSVSYLKRVNNVCNPSTKTKKRSKLKCKPTVRVKVATLICWENFPTSRTFAWLQLISSFFWFLLRIFKNS